MLHYEDVLLFILTKANQRVYGIFKAKLQHYGLTPAQALVLHALYIEEGLSAGELGKRLIFDSATLSGVLDRMADGGWLRKNIAPDDRRLLNIQLTEKALEIKETFLKEIGDTNREILSPFLPEERRLLERMLKDLRG